MEFADVLFDEDTVQKILILNLCNSSRTFTFSFELFSAFWQELMSDSSYIDLLLSSFNAR